MSVSTRFPRLYTPRAKPEVGAVLSRGHGLARGLVNAYIFNEGAGTLVRDYGPRAYHVASNVAAQAGRWETSPYGTALKFLVASSDRLRATPTNALTYQLLGQDANHFTVFWVGKVNSFATTFGVFGRGVSTDKSVRYAATGQVQITTGAGGTTVIAATGNVVSDTKYHAIAALRRGTAGGNEIWIDGVSQSLGTNDTSTAFTDTASLAQLGAQGNGSSTLDGAITCLYVYNRDLSVGEIQQLTAEPYVIFRTPLFQIAMSPKAIAAFSGAGSLTSSGTLKLLTTKGLAGTLTDSGALTKVGNKPLAGTLTDSGSLAKVGQKNLAGTLTDTGALTQLRIKNLAGALTSAGALVKVGSRALTGTLTSSGALTAVKLKVVALAGTLTSSGALVKVGKKALVGSLPSVGVLVQVRSKVLTATLGSSGVLVKRTNLVRVGTLTSSGSLVTTVMGIIVLPISPLRIVLFTDGRTYVEILKSGIVGPYDFLP